MKIIIINDSDSHTWGMAYTPENIKKVRDAAVEMGIAPDDFDELPTDRVFGGICEVIDTDYLQEFPKHNPFI